MEYSAGTSRLFWLSETRKTAELLLNGLSKTEIKELAIKENIYQIRAEDRIRRIASVTLNRLESLPEILVQQLVSGDIGTAKLLVLISIMKTDRLFFEFIHEVHRQAIILGENVITDRAVNAFFDSKIAQSEVVAKWTESAIKKLKQTYIKILHEAGMLSSVKGERKIVTPVVDYKTRQVLIEHHLMVYLNALTGEA